MAGANKIYTPEQLKSFIFAVMKHVGVNDEDSAIMAETLCFANLRGVDTHGIRLLPVYVNRVRQGTLDPGAAIEVLKETPVSALIDGHNGFGQVISYHAMELAVKKAKECGVGIVCVNHSNHFGTAAYFSMMAQKEGLIGFSATNASPRLAPTGGKEAVYGNNPWSVAFPCEEGTAPMVLDMANSVVANSHINVAKQKGTKIPLTWALDKDGAPTDDPFQAVLLLPFGGYKGYGISMAIEAIAGILSGSAYGNDLVGNASVKSKDGQNVGHYFMAIDPTMFMPLDEFNARLKDFTGNVKNSELAKDSTAIYLPGEIEYNKTQDRLASGIPVAEVFVDSVNQLCAELGVEERL